MNKEQLTKNWKILATVAMSLIWALSIMLTVHYWKQYDTSFVQGMQNGANEVAFEIVDSKRDLQQAMEVCYQDINFKLEQLPIPTEDYMQQLEDYAFIDADDRWN